MSTQNDERQASAGQVERPVRPSLSEALDAWWDAAYVEGRDGRTHDTEGGAAQQALQDIWAAHQAALVAAVAAAVAAERERCAQLCEDISDEYQRREGMKYPELKTDAQEGASKCAAAIRKA